jgi:hypothetical protein
MPDRRLKHPILIYTCIFIFCVGANLSLAWLLFF